MSISMKTQAVGKIVWTVIEEDSPYTLRIRTTIQLGLLQRSYERIVTKKQWRNQEAMRRVTQPVARDMGERFFDVKH